MSLAMRAIDVTVKLARKWRRDRKAAYALGKAFLKGSFYVLFYRLLRKNVIIGIPFFAYYRVSICGPGSVRIGKGCSVFPNAFDGLVVATVGAEASVIIGRGSDLGGVTIRSSRKVEIGERGLFANCLIQDSLFTALSPLVSCPRRDQHSDSATVWLGDNVWLAGQTMVLEGGSVGNESVLSVGGVCFDRAIPEKQLAGGNPVVSSLSVERISALLGKS